MEKITFTEFLDWVQFLEQDEKRRDKLDFYLAQLAAEMRRSYVKTPRSVQVKAFYVSYVDPEVAEDRMRKSKAAWGAVFKMDLN